MENSKVYFYPYTVYCYETVDSTNAVAKRAVTMMGSSVDRTVHVTGTQTKGRGRSGRSWINTDDSVMMSIVQSTRLAAEKIPVLNLVAAVAVRNALISLTDHGIDISIKWPNDIVTTDRMEKLCGILSEVVKADNRKYAIIGIGLNLNSDVMPDDLLMPATSVFLETGRTCRVLNAVQQILTEFRIQYDLFSRDPAAFLKNYARGCVSLGRHLCIKEGEKLSYAVGESITAFGQLAVRYESGETGVVSAADVSVRNRVSVDAKLASRLLPKRGPRSHKGNNGRAGIIAGSPNMPGAALMCSGACIRSGAGLTRVLIPTELRSYFSAVPEAMLMTEDASAEELISWANVLAVGCGMEVNERTAGLLEKVLLSKKPCIIDAGALGTLAAYPNLTGLLHENCLLTPHPGEMGRLIGLGPEEVAKELTSTALGYASKHGCCVLLKSASSVIASPAGELRYNDRGSSALAKGGSGDVLAGLITGVAAQGANLFDAATVGAYLLGVSAEECISFLRDRFLEAEDIVDIVASRLNRNNIKEKTDDNT